jgi:hypothetical protein
LRREAPDNQDEEIALFPILIPPTGTTQPNSQNIIIPEKEREFPVLPLPPPVITATNPLTENSFGISRCAMVIDKLFQLNLSREPRTSQEGKG